MTQFCFGIRNEQGLVPNEKLMFLWKQNTTLAHEEVNVQMYENYFSEYTSIVIFLLIRLWLPTVDLIIEKRTVSYIVVTEWKK
jgi:hypothetical protein